MEIIARNIAAEINGSANKKEFNGHGACFLDIGSIAAYASGNFFAEPKPQVNVQKPGRIWHFAKVAFEK